MPTSPPPPPPPAEPCAEELDQLARTLARAEADAAAIDACLANQGEATASQRFQLSLVVSDIKTMRKRVHMMRLK